MPAPITPLDRAIAEGAARAFARRAAELRKIAAGNATTIQDQWGRDVQLISPEAVVMLGTAAFLEDCAADIAAQTPRRGVSPAERGSP